MRGSVRKRGDSWYYSFEGAKVDGHRKRFERYGGITRADAEKALRKALDEYERGGIKVELNNMSVADYFDYWYENYVMKNLKHNTQINYLNIINKYIKPVVGKYKVQSINIASLQNMFNDLGDSGLKKHTVEIIGTVVKSGFKMAVFPYQIIKENPAQYIRMPRFTDEDDRITRQSLKIISLEQYNQLLDMFPPAHPFHMPLVIAFNTGMRRGEVCGLEWKNVDLDEGVIHVREIMNQFKRDELELGTPKTKASIRDILIGQTLIDELKAKRKRQLENKLQYRYYYHENKFVCTDEDGSAVTPNSVKYYAEKAQNELGFPFSFHSLRHTHATMLLENGAKPKEVQARLGHSKLETTMDTYVHVTRKMEKHTVDIMERLQNKNA